MLHYFLKARGPSEHPTCAVTLANRTPHKATSRSIARLVPFNNRWGAIRVMAGSTFQTNPIDLNKLLDDCHRGIIQLPDFQRSWVWDEDRIKSLIASVSRAFPVGALMSLDSGGPVNFKPRPVEGAPLDAQLTPPQSLLLDGQQRMTSLYQVTLRGKVVETVTPKNKKVKRWFYVDIRKALDPSIDREEAIVGVPEDKIERSDFGRKIDRDLSAPEKEYASLMYPVCHFFDWDRWQDGFDEYWSGDTNKSVREEFRELPAPDSRKFQILPRAGHQPRPIHIQGGGMRCF